MLSVDLKIKREGLDNMEKSDIVGAFTGELSKRIVELAKENSRVDTGAMQKGWNRSKIGEGRRGGWRIFNTVPYTVHNEFGTVHMPAQPMLGPAVDEVSEMIPEEARKIIEASVVGGVYGGGDGGE